MLDTKTLRLLVKEIYNLEDSHILLIAENWFLPNINFDNKNETIIGYRIVSKKLAENYISENLANTDILRVNFRLCFLGKNAEDLCTQILFWNNNHEINSIFNKYNIELTYDGNVMFTYPLKGKKENAWIFDLSAYTI